MLSVFVLTDLPSSIERIDPKDRRQASVAFLKLCLIFFHPRGSDLQDWKTLLWLRIQWDLSSKRA